MTWPDLINGTFEASGSLFILRSIFLLHKQKLVRGVSLIHVAFFMAWGWWNLYYYPHLGQWLSFGGGCLIVLTNSFWVGQIIFYLSTERKSK